VKSSFKVATVDGIDVAIHYSWGFAFLLIGWSLAAGVYPRSFEGWSRQACWATGLVSVVFLFVSVLLHEFSHALLARAKGLPVLAITLFVFGGASRVG